MQDAVRAHRRPESKGKTGVRHAATVAMVLIVSVGAVSADEPNTPPIKPERGSNYLREVMVTAARAEMESFAAPYSTEVVDVSGFWTHKMPATATDTLTTIPGVMIQKTSNAQGSPYIRGWTGFRTLMLLDGIRLNNSVFRDGPNQYWNLVDPMAIDRMEVVRGPSSVLYGSDAIGGTVNAIFKRPHGYGEGWQQSGSLTANLATAQRMYVGRGEINATYGPWLGILVGGAWKHFGNIDGGRSVGPQSHTGYEMCTGDVRIEYHPNEDSTLTFGHYVVSKDDAWRQHKTIYGISWEGTEIGSENARILDEVHTLTYLRYQRRNLGAFIDALELTASFQTLRERRFRERSDFRADEQGVDVRTLGLSAQFTSPSQIGTWTYGVDWYRDWVDSYKLKWNADGSLNERDIQGPVGDDATYDLLGVYVQNRMPLGERVELTLGGRYNYARADADSVKDPDTGNRIGVSDSWDSLVGSARLSWFVDPEEHWNVFGGVSQGFRAPNLSDLTRLDTARSDEIETPSPGLDPEHFISYEVGVKASYENVAAQASYFFTDVSDMIVRTPTGDIVSGDQEVTKKNAGDGYVHGVEVSAQYRFAPQWTAFGNFAWVYGEVDTYPTSDPILKREPISRLAPPTGTVGVRWEDMDLGLWLQASCTVACKADKLSTRDKGDDQRIPPGGTPGYTKVDITGGYRINENIDIWAGVDNILNEDYRIHGSGVNEPGTNVRLGVTVKF